RGAVRIESNELREVLNADGDAGCSGLSKEAPERLRDLNPLRATSRGLVHRSRFVEHDVHVERLRLRFDLRSSAAAPGAGASGGAGAAAGGRSAALSS